jgi:hypothetical protein
MTTIKEMAVVDRDFLLQNIKSIKQKLEKQGYHLTKQLGEESAFGMAFETSDGKVLKITTDQDELETSAKLLKKTLKHVVKIFKVFILTSLPEVGFILQEKLEPLTAKEEDIVGGLGISGTITIRLLKNILDHHKLDDIEEIKDYLADKLESEEIAEYRWQKVKPYFKKAERDWSKLNQYLKAFIAKIIFNESGRSYILKLIDNNLEMITKIFDSLNELFNKNIHFTDTHSRNLMKDSTGIYKWIDIGAGSKAGGAGKIEHIEGEASTKYNIEQQLDKLKIKLEKIGYVNIKPLSYAPLGGSQGIAFKTTDDKILKITADKSEALISSKLIGKNLKHVVEFFRVFTFKSTPNIYFILQEKLLPINLNEKEIIDSMNFRGTPDYRRWTKFAKKYKLKTLEDFKKYYEEEETPKLKFKQQGFLIIEKYISDIKNLSDVFRGFLLIYLARMDSIGQLIEVLEHSDFIEKMLIALEDLIKNKIVYEDATGSNLMKNNEGIYKWIDLGYSSKAPGRSKIEHIEGAKQVGTL